MSLSDNTNILATSPPINIPSPNNKHSGFFGGWWIKERIESKRTTNNEVLKESSSTDTSSNVKKNMLQQTDTQNAGVIVDEKKEDTIDTISNTSSSDMFQLDDIDTSMEEETKMKKNDLILDDSDVSDSDDESLSSELDDFEEDLYLMKFGNRFYEFNDYVRRNRRHYRNTLENFNNYLLECRNSIDCGFRMCYDDQKDLWACFGLLTAINIMGALEYTVYAFIIYSVIFDNNKVVSEEIIINSSEIDNAAVCDDETKTIN